MFYHLLRRRVCACIEGGGILACGLNAILIVGGASRSSAAGVGLSALVLRVARVLRLVWQRYIFCWAKTGTNLHYHEHECDFRGVLCGPATREYAERDGQTEWEHQQERRGKNVMAVDDVVGAGSGGLRRRTGKLKIG